MRFLMVETDPAKLTEELKRLNEERAKGHLTEQEHINKKRELVGVTAAATTAVAGLTAVEQSSLSVRSIIADATGTATSKLTKLGKVTGTVSSGIETLSKLLLPAFALTTQWGSALANPRGELVALSKFLPHANATIKNLRDTQLTAREAVAKFGGSMKVAQYEAERYTTNLRRTALGLGLTTKALDRFVKQSSVVPDSLRPISLAMAGIINRTGQAALPIAILETTMRGMGFAAGKSTSTAVAGFETFGQKIPTVVIEMGKMTAAADLFKGSTTTIIEQIRRASQNLAIFGTGIGSATNLWRTFATTLQSGGVPLREIGGIVEKVTSGIANMSVQQRAFISMLGGRGGGRGALAGALKMELEMRQPGGMNRQLQDLTRTLARFGGGRIITLQQAVRQPGMEQQFLLQRQMLNKLGIQGTAEQQNRVLEVLNKVQTGGMSQVEGSKALNKAFDSGKSIQERSLTTIERIEQILRTMAGEKIDEATNKLDESIRSLGGGVDVIARTALRTRPGTSIRAEPGFVRASQKFLTDLRNIPKSLTSGTSKLIEPRRGIIPQYREAERATARLLGRTRTERGRVVTPLRAPRSPTFRAFTATVHSGDVTKIRILQQIRDLTRDTITPLQTLATAIGKTAEGKGTVAHDHIKTGEETPNELTIRIIAEGPSQKEYIHKVTLGR